MFIESNRNARIRSATLSIVTLACLLAPADPFQSQLYADDPIDQLRQWIAVEPASRPPLDGAPFANLALSREDAEIAKALLWDDFCRRLRQERAAEIEGKFVRIGEMQMKYEALKLNLDQSDNQDLVQDQESNAAKSDAVSSDQNHSTALSTDPAKPEQRLSLFISMHGGGQTAARVNESQWRNQIRLGQQYRPQQALYVAPRAPTDTWNLWHEAHIDRLFDRLISTLVVTESVDPNQVYLMGYSAGGDGVYQLAPRMADRFAAAAMMAGHPNDADPKGLRNLPFTIHIGENDKPFQRNEVAAQWGQKLSQLKEHDSQGYPHWVEIHPDKGHWMDLQDQSAIPWMQQYRRNLFPEKVVWRQSGVKHNRFYWLAVDPDSVSSGDEIVAVRKGQQIIIERPVGQARIEILLDDQFIDLQLPIEVSLDGRVAYQGTVQRRIKTLSATLEQRGDPAGMFSSSVTLEEK